MNIEHPRQHRHAYFWTAILQKMPIMYFNEAVQYSPHLVTQIECLIYLKYEFLNSKKIEKVIPT
jgi:hypothetical protein